MYGASLSMNLLQTTVNMRNVRHQPYNTVEQLRNHLLQEEVLRQPFLHIFKSVYNDNTDFPEDLKLSTPIADHIPNMSKVHEIRRHPSTDDCISGYIYGPWRF